MSKASSAFVQANDPGYSDSKTEVIKTTILTVPGDTVTVNTGQDSISIGKWPVVVLLVKANARATASVDRSTGVVTLTGSGSGTPQFLLITLATTDTVNWTAYVNTSGGTNYMFVKGNGGR